MAPHKYLPHRLHEARVMRGFTQVEVARDMGLSRTCLCLYESGGRDVPNNVITYFSDMYCVSIDWLYGVTDNYERQTKDITTTARQLIYQYIDKHQLKGKLTLAEFREAEEAIISVIASTFDVIAKKGRIE